MRMFSCIVIAFILCFYTSYSALPKECITKEKSLCIQKCCPYNNFNTDNGCVKNFNYTLSNTVTYPVYEVRYSEVNIIPSNFNITLYSSNETRIRFFDMSNEMIILSNTSALIIKEATLMPSKNYCLEYYESDNSINVKLYLRFTQGMAQEPSKRTNKAAGLYFPLLLMSAISFFVSGLFYLFVLKVDNRNNKKCFVGYSMSMGLSFLSLVILQKIKSGCLQLGAFFLMCTTSGFVWLTFLCLDLLFDIMYFEQGYHTKSLWVTYLVVSVLIPVIVVLTPLLFSNSTLDIPSTFIKSYSAGQGCSFQNNKRVTFFVPIGIALLLSWIFICMCVYYIKYNDQLHGSHFPWLDKKSKYKYRTISCGLIWILLMVWMIETAATTFSDMLAEMIPLDLIEALQGIFALLIFVSDRYTRKELRKICNKNTRTDESFETELAINFGSTRQRNETESLVNNSQTKTDS